MATGHEDEYLLLPVPEAVCLFISAARKYWHPARGLQRERESQSGLCVNRLLNLVGF